MGRIYFVFLVVAMFATFAKGITNYDARILVNNQEAVHRNLKASSTIDATSEERMPSVSRLFSFLKRKTTGLNFLRRNPSVASTLERNPAVAKQVETLYQKPGLVNSFKSSDDLAPLRHAVKQNPSELTTAKLEKIGSAVKTSTAARGLDDEEGMLLAYGILFVMLVIIGGVGYNMAHSS